MLGAERALPAALACGAPATESRTRIADCPRCRCHSLPCAIGTTLSPSTNCGYLHADAYAGYDAMFSDLGSQIIEVACWSHSRSNFFDAVRRYPREAHQVLEWIRQLDDIEDRAHDSSLEARRALRVAQAVPVLDKIATYLAQLAVSALPKSTLGKAVAYARNQWQALRRYTEDGRLTIDNNVSERTLRHQAIGRKNWLSWAVKRRGPEPPCCTRSWRVPSVIISSRGRTSAIFCSVSIPMTCAGRNCCLTAGPRRIPRRFSTTVCTNRASKRSAPALAGHIAAPAATDTSSVQPSRPLHPNVALSSATACPGPAETSAAKIALARGAMPCGPIPPLTDTRPLTRRNHGQNGRLLAHEVY
jgi:hypothetical protein